MLILLGPNITVLEGLPNHLQFIYCNSALEIMTENCFTSTKCCSAIKRCLNLNKMKQPPGNVIAKGKDRVMKYYENRKHVMNAGVRVGFLGDTGAGKTSLVQSLTQGKPMLTSYANRTHAVEVTKVPYSATQHLTLVDYGGHPVYDICHPYFINKESTILVTHNLSKPEMIARTKQIFRHVLHRHPQNAIHFVLTHIDTLDAASEIDVRLNEFQDEMSGMLKEQIDNIKRISHRQKIEGRKLSEKYVYQLDKIHYFLLSSLSFEGVNNLWEFLIENTRILPDDIHENCIQFYCALQAEALFVLNYADGLSMYKDMFPNSACTASKNDFYQCLNYLSNSGHVMLMQQPREEESLIFPTSDVLVSLFKCVFHHDLESKLCFEDDLHLQAVFQEEEFNRALKKYQQHGLIQEKLLCYLWSHSCIPSGHSSEFIQLIKKFHIFHETGCQQLEEQSYFVPWLLKYNLPPGNLDVQKPMTFSNTTFSLWLQCLFHGSIPLNITEFFCLELQRYAIEQRYLDRRHGWTDGLQVTIGPNQITIFKNNATNELNLVVKGDIRNDIDPLAKAWASFKELHHRLNVILAPYLGVVRSLHIVCPHCVLQKIEPPAKWLPIDVFQEKASDNRYATCEKDEVTSVPSALLTYHPDYDLSKQENLVQNYLRQSTSFQIMEWRHPSQSQQQQFQKVSYNLMMENIRLKTALQDITREQYRLSEQLHAMGQGVSLQLEATTNDLTSMKGMALKEPCEEQDHTDLHHNGAHQIPINLEFKLPSETSSSLTELAPDIFQIEEDGEKKPDTVKSKKNEAVAIHIENNVEKEERQLRHSKKVSFNLKPEPVILTQPTADLTIDQDDIQNAGAKVDDDGEDQNDDSIKNDLTMDQSKLGCGRLYKFFCSKREAAVKPKILKARAKAKTVKKHPVASTVYSSIKCAAKKKAGKNNEEDDDHDSLWCLERLSLDTNPRFRGYSYPDDLLDEVYLNMDTLSNQVYQTGRALSSKIEVQAEKGKKHVEVTKL